MSGLEFELDGDRRLLRVVPREALEKGDFTALTTTVDGFLDQGGTLTGLVIDADRFPGWEDFGAFLAHLRFVRAHHTVIRRVAVVTDDRMEPSTSPTGTIRSSVTTRPATSTVGATRAMVVSGDFRQRTSLR